MPAPAAPGNGSSEFGDPRSPGVDPVDWIERIPIDESRDYVKKVLANIQVYRALLGDPKEALAGPQGSGPGAVRRLRRQRLQRRLALQSDRIPLARHLACSVRRLRSIGCDWISALVCWFCRIFFDDRCPLRRNARPGHSGVLDHGRGRTGRHFPPLADVGFERAAGDGRQRPPSSAAPRRNRSPRCAVANC